MWNSFDINVLVNGNRCKQYNHEGQVYVEAKDGSEWFLQIQNNSGGRILAVTSVDGLNTLTGKTAKSTDSGYIIPAYSSQKIKGFRFSDNEWALFRFGYKLNGNTYAQQKGKGQDCGVVGVRLFYEKAVRLPSPPIYKPYPWHCSGSSNIQWHAGSAQTYNCCTSTLGGLYGNGRHGYDDSEMLSAPKKRSATKSGLMKAANFDMGTEFGRREESKVEHVEFERGSLAHTGDIYYASRDSLIDMGIVLSNNPKLPKSFSDNDYCKPPKNWNGQ